MEGIMMVSNAVFLGSAAVGIAGGIVINFVRDNPDILSTTIAVLFG